MTSPVFDADLVRRYDIPGPRYTSYPTAAEFRDESSATSATASGVSRAETGWSQVRVILRWGSTGRAVTAVRQ